MIDGSKYCPLQCGGWKYGDYLGRFGEEGEQLKKVEWSPIIVLVSYQLNNYHIVSISGGKSYPIIVSSIISGEKLCTLITLVLYQGRNHAQLLYQYHIRRKSVHNYHIGITSGGTFGPIIISVSYRVIHNSLTPPRNAPEHFVGTLRIIAETLAYLSANILMDYLF